MQFSYENNRFFALGESDTLLAEIVFPFTAPGTVDITRTFVDESLRGQGIADLLMRAAVEKIRAEGYKTAASCPYAARWFEKHPEFADLMV